MVSTTAAVTVIVSTVVPRVTESVNSFRPSREAGLISSPVGVVNGTSMKSRAAAVKLLPPTAVTTPMPAPAASRSNTDVAPRLIVAVVAVLASSRKMSTGMTKVWDAAPWVIARERSTMTVHPAAEAVKVSPERNAADSIRGSNSNPAGATGKVTVSGGAVLERRAGVEHRGEGCRRDRAQVRPALRQGREGDGVSGVELAGEPEAESQHARRSTPA